MADFKKIVVLENEVAASYIEAQLQERDIPFIIRSYHDSAYDGMFQFQKGWGHVESDDAHRQIIESIYQDMMDAFRDSKNSCWPNDVFWDELDSLVKSSELEIDRPRGASHPRYPGLIYPLDYGFLKNTTSSDGAEIDIWIGDAATDRVDAVMCIIDQRKRDAEIKVLYRCTKENMQAINKIHNSEGMNGLLIER